MHGLRRLNDGQWNKPPVLTAARRLFMRRLAEVSPTKPLGELASFVNGTSYDVGKLSEDGTPVIRISNITDPTSSYLRTHQTFPERFMVEPGDLLVSWSASFKSILWPGPRGVLNQHIFRVSEQDGNHRSFVRHAIEAAFDEMRANAVGIGMMHLRRGDFLGHAVPAPQDDVQRMVSAFLDWLESGTDGPEPPLPQGLSEQRRIVARVEELATKIEEARRLRRKTAEDLQSLSWSFLFGGKWPTSQIPMRDVLTLRPPDVEVEADTLYRFAGVYSFGRGVFPGQYKRGSDFAYRRLTYLQKDNFVYPKLMAWEGALGVVPPDCDGLVVSPEFPVFEVHEDKVLPEVLDTYFRSPEVWPLLSAVSTGTNLRRRRLHPDAFLNFQAPLPSMEVQLKFRELRTKLRVIEQNQVAVSAELDVLLPSVLDRAFQGDL